MDERSPSAVSFAAFESMKTTMERTTRRLWILALVLIALLFGTNAAWLYYESQFTDEVTETYSSSVDGDGGLAIVNRDGSVTNYGGQSDLHTDEEADP